VLGQWVASAGRPTPGWHGTDQATLANLSDTLASASVRINAAGDLLVWGITVPRYAWAILTTGALARSVGWLGLVVALFAGWLGMFAATSPVVELLSNVGFPAFFVFNAVRGNLDASPATPRRTGRNIPARHADSSHLMATASASTSSAAAVTAGCCEPSGAARRLRRRSARPPCAASQ
jgi:hypothetical protein